MMSVIKGALKSFRKEFYKRASDVATRLFLCLMLPVMVVRYVFFKLRQRKGSGNKTLYFTDNQGRSIVGWLDVFDYLLRGEEAPRPDYTHPTYIVPHKGRPHVFYPIDHKNPPIRLDQQGNIYTKVDNKEPEAFRKYSDAPVEACQLGHFSLFNRIGFVDLATSVHGLGS